MFWSLSCEWQAHYKGNAASYLYTTVTQYNDRPVSFTKTRSLTLRLYYNIYRTCIAVYITIQHHLQIDLPIII